MQLTHNDQHAAMKAAITVDHEVMMGPHAMKNAARLPGCSRELEAVAGHVRKVKPSKAKPLEPCCLTLQRRELDHGRHAGSAES